MTSKILFFISVDLELTKNFGVVEEELNGQVTRVETFFILFVCHFLFAIQFSVLFTIYTLNQNA